MPKLPTSVDSTLAAADAVMLANAKRWKPKSLGASWIGEQCERAIWLKFRHAGSETLTAQTLKRFEDGHRTEDLVIARVKQVHGLEWHDKDPETNWQYGFRVMGKHFKGFYDGIVKGLIQAPQKWHIGEVKATAKWADLEKAKAKLGEKNALLSWNSNYYAAAQVYMHYEGVDRHWMIAASPGGRDWVGCRTDADPVYAMKLVAKAERIIFSDEAPARAGDATNYLCRWCDFAPICHGNALPERACRNCIHATPERDGDARWSCNVREFGTLCEAHRFLPSMINGEQINVVDGDVVVYRMRDGEEWSDHGKAESS